MSGFFNEFRRVKKTVIPHVECGSGQEVHLPILLSPHVRSADEESIENMIRIEMKRNCKHTVPSKDIALEMLSIPSGSIY